MIKSIYYITTRPAFTRPLFLLDYFMSEKGGIPPLGCFIKQTK